MTPRRPTDPRPRSTRANSPEGVRVQQLLSINGSTEVRANSPEGGRVQQLLSMNGSTEVRANSPEGVRVQQQPYRSPQFALPNRDSTSEDDDNNSSVGSIPNRSDEDEEVSQQTTGGAGVGRAGGARIPPESALGPVGLNAFLTLPTAQAIDIQEPVKRKILKLLSRCIPGGGSCFRTLEEEDDGERAADDDQEEQGVGIGNITLQLNNSVENQQTPQVTGGYNATTNQRRERVSIPPIPGQVVSNSGQVAPKDNPDPRRRGGYQIGYRQNHPGLNYQRLREEAQEFTLPANKVRWKETDLSEPGHLLGRPRIIRAPGGEVLSG